MPIEQEVLAEFKAFLRMLRDAARSRRAAARGKKGGEERRENGFVPRILAKFAELLANKIPPRRHAKLIAQALNCNVEYVRRIRRREIFQSTL